jgi:DNA-directed RNA polymerase subunit RPC12/RpoP
MNPSRGYAFEEENNEDENHIGENDSPIRKSLGSSTYNCKTCENIIESIKMPYRLKNHNGEIYKKDFAHCPRCDYYVDSYTLKKIEFERD